MSEEIRGGEYTETDLRLAAIQQRNEAEAHLRRVPLARTEILAAISVEVDRAKIHGEKFASLHEAYAVILEELDEVWDITRQKRCNRSAVDLRKEFIQLGAMAVKSLESLDRFVGGTV